MAEVVVGVGEAVERVGLAVSVGERLAVAARKFTGPADVHVNAGLAVQAARFLVQAQGPVQVAEGVVVAAQLDLRTGDAAAGLGLCVLVAEAPGSREGDVLGGGPVMPAGAAG